MREMKAYLVVSNETKNLATVRDFVLNTLKEAGAPDSCARQIVLAVDEAVSNIIRHAYKEFSSGTRTIDITLLTRGRCVEVILRDSGKEFDPATYQDPDIKEHVKQRKKYGLGLFLIRKIMDEVKYLFKSGVENELRMVKYINTEEES